MPELAGGLGEAVDEQDHAFGIIGRGALAIDVI